MDIILILLGLLFMCFGLIGSVVPVMPGPPLSWIGLLFLFMTDAVQDDWVFLGITLAIALIVFFLDYIIPAIGTKKFGGSKSGMVGTTIGLVIGIFAPIPGGIIICPFLGAFIGELTNNSDSKAAMKAAFGSFLGFITGTFLKFIVAVIYFGLFIKIFWEYKDFIF